MFWLTAWWKLAGYAPAVTRTAMLALAAFGLLGVYRLAERVTNRQVAIASLVLTAIYPVVFAQSSLAQLDIAAFAFTTWAVFFYISGKPSFPSSVLRWPRSRKRPPSLLHWRFACGRCCAGSRTVPAAPPGSEVVSLSPANRGKGIWRPGTDQRRFGAVVGRAAAGRLVCFSRLAHRPALRRRFSSPQSLRQHRSRAYSAGIHSAPLACGGTHEPVHAHCGGVVGEPSAVTAGKRSRNTGRRKKPRSSWTAGCKPFSCC